MKMMESIGGIFSYISEAVGRVFAPLEDHYPATGILPFDGDITHASGWNE